MVDRHIIRIAKEILQDLEGLKLEAYKDGAGVWTIGYGASEHRYSWVKKGVTITEEKANQLLEDEVILLHRQIREVITYPLPGESMAALISFVYNVGVGAFNNSTMRQRINKADLELLIKPKTIKASNGLSFTRTNEFERWTIAGGRHVYGLYNRRVREYELYRTGINKIS